MTSKSTSKLGSVAMKGPNTGPTITATSQTTRFHVDTLTTLSKEVKVLFVLMAHILIGYYAPD